MIYAILWGHWLADFVFQTDQMAKGKSSSLRWLGVHIATYTPVLSLVVFFLTPTLSLQRVLLWGLLNGALHFLTDFVTSKMTKRLWAEGRVHDFFVVIGLDQAIHYSTAVATARWLLGPL